MPWVQIQAYHFPGYTIFQQILSSWESRWFKLNVFLDDFWIFYSDSGVQSNLSLITITNDGFVLQLVWTTSLSFSTFLGMDWTVCLVLWPWFFRWCRWIIWLLRLLWFATCSHSCFGTFFRSCFGQDRFLCPGRALRGYLDKSKISGKARKFFLYLLRRATPRFRCRIIWMASEWLGMSYFWDLVDLFHKGSF